MNVSTHVATDQLFQIFRLVAPILACITGPMVAALWSESDSSRMFLITAGVGLIVIGVAWYLIPIRCIRDGCAGRMRRGEERISFWRVRATYRCEDCDMIHEVEIFNPNIEITYGDY